MNDPSLRDLEQIEKRLRYVYTITSRILSITRDLFDAVNGETRMKLSIEIDENLALVEILKREITEDLLTYAIRYQPLGRDFRRVHIFLDVLYDIFRIGRYCREIALVDRYVKKLSDESLKDLKELLDLAREAYKNTYQVLFEDCVVCVDKVQEIENEVDELYINILKEIGSINTLPNSAVARVLVMRHIERIVDHIMSIVSYKRNLP